MQSTPPIDASASISNTYETQRKSHALIFVINIILLLAVIACTSAPLSQSVKYITTFAGIGGILLIDVIYCAVIYACNASDKEKESNIPSQPPPPAILPKCTLGAACDPKYLEFLTKLGLKNVNGEFPTLEMTFSEITNFHTLIPEIREKLMELKIPEKGIILIRGQDSKLRIYLATTFRLFTPQSSDIVELICASPTWRMNKFDLEMSAFDEDPDIFKNLMDLLKKQFETNQQGSV